MCTHYLLKYWLIVLMKGPAIPYSARVSLCVCSLSANIVQRFNMNRLKAGLAGRINAVGIIIDFSSIGDAIYLCICTSILK